MSKLAVLTLVSMSSLVACAAETGTETTNDPPSAPEVQAAPITTTARDMVVTPPTRIDLQRSGALGHRLGATTLDWASDENGLVHTMSSVVSMVGRLGLNLTPVGTVLDVISSLLSFATSGSGTANAAGQLQGALQQIETDLHTIESELEHISVHIDHTHLDDAVHSSVAAVGQIRFDLGQGVPVSTLIASAADLETRAAIEITASANSCRAVYVDHHDWWETARGVPLPHPAADGTVYDSRLCAPALISAIALRMSAIVMLDPNFAVDGRYDAEIDRMRSLIQGIHDHEASSIRCGQWYYGLVNEYQYGNPQSVAVPEWIEGCVNIDNGVNSLHILPFEQFNSNLTQLLTYPPYSPDPMRDTIEGNRGTFEEQATADSLAQAISHHGDLTQGNHLIRLTAPEAGTGSSLCLRWGLPFTLAHCNSADGLQLFTYNREARNITAPDHFDWHVDMTADDSLAIEYPFTPNLTSWTYNPRTGVLMNDSGRVLDVQWGNNSAGAQVWTWAQNGQYSQQWLHGNLPFTIITTPPTIFPTGK